MNAIIPLSWKIYFYYSTIKFIAYYSIIVS